MRGAKPDHFFVDGVKDIDNSTNAWKNPAPPTALAYVPNANLNTKYRQYKTYNGTVNFTVFHKSILSNGYPLVFMNFMTIGQTNRSQSKRQEDYVHVMCEPMVLHGIDDKIPINNYDNATY